ncbi:helix-turn-helix domain-containing protein [bacterium]|nr:helix-turn-helix domain-containing protein [bacterium]MBU1958945.1 helix-turn-helix domain-containing protein [bacterium]
MNRPTPPQPVFNLRPSEASHYLGIGLSTLWYYVKQGKINSIKLSPRVTIFKKEELDNFITTMSENNQTQKAV